MRFAIELESEKHIQSDDYSFLLLRHSLRYSVPHGDFQGFNTKKKNRHRHRPKSSVAFTFIHG